MASRRHTAEHKKCTPLDEPTRQRNDPSDGCVSLLQCLSSAAHAAWSPHTKNQNPTRKTFQSHHAVNLFDSLHPVGWPQERRQQQNEHGDDDKTCGNDPASGPEEGNDKKTVCKPASDAPVGVWRWCKRDSLAHPATATHVSAASWRRAPHVRNKALIASNQIRCNTKVPLASRSVWCLQKAVRMRLHVCLIPALLVF